jgi:hypothetical protein
MEMVSRMPTCVNETRHVQLGDLPLVRRLTAQGAFLDSELGLTRAQGGLQSAVLSSLFLPQSNLYTMLARSDNRPVVGQFRLCSNNHLAQMTFISPDVNATQSDTCWLALLDSLTAAAGRRGAHVLTAEVDENSPLFETMRTAGFAVYSREVIWRHLPDEPLVANEIAHLTPETDADALDIQLLYCHVVPTLVQQVAVPSAESTGLVYRNDGATRGYVTITQGRYGAYIVPYLHPDVVFHEAAAILAGAIDRVSKAQQAPVYVCVRRYQDWLDETLIDMEFEPWMQRALLARHIAAGVRHASFTPLKSRLDAVPSPVRPPTSNIAEARVETFEQQVS